MDFTPQQGVFPLFNDYFTTIFALLIVGSFMHSNTLLLLLLVSLFIRNNPIPFLGNARPRDFVMENLINPIIGKFIKNDRRHS